MIYQITINKYTYKCILKKIFNIKKKKIIIIIIIIIKIIIIYIYTTNIIGVVW